MNVRTPPFAALLLVVSACSSTPPSTTATAVTPAAAPATPAPAGALEGAERAAFDRVSEETIRSVTTTLASREMEGRGTALPGGERAARWIADRWRAIGLVPAGDSNTFFQQIRFAGTTALPTSHIRAGSARLTLGADFTPYLQPSTDSLDLTAPVVFVGYGVQSTALNRDDFAGVDLAGKIAVLLSGRPPSSDSVAWAQNAGVQRAFGAIFSRGARAVLLANAGTAQNPYETIAGYLTRRRVEMDQGAAAGAGPVVAFLGPAGAAKLWSVGGLSYEDAKRKADAGAASQQVLPSATIALRFRRDRGVGSNVAGVLRGSDPALADQAVLYTAHYDAFGVGEDGRVYPGAADNALGVAMITSVAEAMAALPQRPRRSVIFLAVTGEEHGLFGAEYWARNPTWPIGRVAANLNLDGIGTETYGAVERVVGWGAEHSSLGNVMRDVVVATGNQVAPDPFPEENIFVRSDHYALVKVGVPALMLLGAPADSTWPQRAKAWLSGPYHQPGDSVRTDWSWSGPRELAAVALLIGLRVANADSMPSWIATSPFNKPRGVGASR